MEIKVSFHLHFLWNNSCKIFDWDNAIGFQPDQYWSSWEKKGLFRNILQNLQMGTMDIMLLFSFEKMIF